MRVEDWGLIEYEPTVAKQLLYVEEVNAGAEECLVMCTHPPVVTLGRGSQPDDIAGWKGSLVESSRGGRATYHGPSQVVIYPIVDLKRARGTGKVMNRTIHVPNDGISFPARDIHAYLRALEELTVTSLRECGLQNPEARTSNVGGVSLTGVWSGDKKIASIGIAVRKWITYHGIAVNVLHDPQAFRGINPCGFQPGTMTSLEAQLGRSVKIGEIKEIFATIFRSGLSRLVPATQMFQN